MAQVICLQPVAIVDHVAHVNEDQLTAILGDEEQHGSRRVDAATAQKLLGQIGTLSIVRMSDRGFLSSLAGRCECLVWHRMPRWLHADMCHRKDRAIGIHTFWVMLLRLRSFWRCFCLLSGIENLVHVQAP